MAAEPNLEAPPVQLDERAQAVIEQSRAAVEASRQTLEEARAAAPPRREGRGAVGGRRE